MRIHRLFTKENDSPYSNIEFRKASSEIKNPDGSVVFRLDDIDVPADWSQVACDVLAQKYFRKAGVPKLLKKFEENDVPSWLWRRVPDIAGRAELPEEVREQLQDIRQMYRDVMEIERDIRRGDGEPSEDVLAERNRIVQEIVDSVVDLLDEAEVNTENAPQLLRLLGPSFGPRRGPGGPGSGQDGQGGCSHPLIITQHERPGRMDRGAFFNFLINFL